MPENPSAPTPLTTPVPGGSSTQKFSVSSRGVPGTRGTVGREPPGAGPRPPRPTSYWLECPQCRAGLTVHLLSLAHSPYLKCPSCGGFNASASWRALVWGAAPEVFQETARLDQLARERGGK